MIKLTNNKKSQIGSVSLFVVIFATLLITVVTVSFVRIMIKDQQQANATDLSQSAYDSALAGVEDAKRAILRYQSLCANADNKETCANSSNIKINSTICNDAVGKLANISLTSDGVPIQTNSTANNLQQFYTCTKINMNPGSYLGALNKDETKIIPLIGTESFKKVKIEWYSQNDLQQSGSPINLPNNVSLINQNSWPSSRPPMFRVQVIQKVGNVKLTDFDDNMVSGNKAAINRSMFLYPLNVENDNNLSFSPQKDSNLAPVSVGCSHSSVTPLYYCSAIIELSAEVNTSDNKERSSLIILKSLYNKADFKVSLLDTAENNVNFDEVQAEIDSTGRANNVFRRVKVNVELGDTNALSPEAELDITGNLCKNFIVTDNSEDYYRNTNELHCVESASSLQETTPNTNPPSTEPISTIVDPVVPPIITTPVVVPPIAQAPVVVPTINYQIRQSPAGKFVDINNPEWIPSGYIADTVNGVAGKTIYNNSFNGNLELYYGHAIFASTYYAIRFYNPSLTTSVNLKVNNSGLETVQNIGASTGSEYTQAYTQYFSGSNVTPYNNYTIAPRQTVTFFHNGNTFADNLSSAKKIPASSHFGGVMNLTSTGDLAFSTFIFNDFSKTGNATYPGNYNDRPYKSLSDPNNYYSRQYSQSISNLPFVVNNVNFNFNDSVPANSNLDIKYPDGVLSDKWLTNASGAYVDLNNGNQIVSYDAAKTDILPMVFPLTPIPQNNGITSLTSGAYPSLDPRINWQYNIANWGVHYIENITIKNDGSRARDVSFYINNSPGQTIIAFPESLSEGNYIDRKSITPIRYGSAVQDIKIWKISVPANSSRTVSSRVLLGPMCNGGVRKFVKVES